MAQNKLILNALQDFGLSEKESKIYIALLELEIGTVQEIAKATGVNRSSAYVVLESLKMKGLVSVSDRSKTRKYIATTPEAILSSAEDKVANEGRIASKIKQVLPDMKALYKETKQKPLVKVFEGKEGLIFALAETLNAKDKLVRVCSSAKMLFEIIPDFLPIYAAKRKEENIALKAIFPLTKKSEDLIMLWPKLYSAAYIPEEKYILPSDIAIWNNNIAYAVTQGTQIATIVIESMEIAGIMRAIFDLAFNEAARIGVKKSAR